MVEQILIGSCEHQRYRRAAQLAMLEYFRYPIEMIDVAYGYHADFYDTSIVIDSLKNMGMKPRPLTPRYKYNISVTELKARMLTRIIETGKNTIMVEDDHCLVISKYDLNNKLRNLTKKVDISPEVIQMYPRKRNIDHPVIPIPEAEDFEHGCYGGGHLMLFITPFGAEKLLEFMRDPKTPLSLENGMAKFLGNEPWIYSVVPDQKRNFVKSLEYIEGESIGIMLTKTGQSIRRTDERIERSKRIIEHFKL